MSLFTSKKGKKPKKETTEKSGKDVHTSSGSTKSVEEKKLDKVIELMTTIIKGNGTQSTLDELVLLVLGEGYKVDDTFEMESGGEALIIKIKNICLNYRPEILKLAKPGILKDSKKRIRFLRGAALQGQLNYYMPFSVPQVYAPNWEPTYIKMQYIPGEALLEYASEATELEIIKIFLQILKIVGISHQHKIIHRDLKVTNFRVTKNMVTGCIEPVMLDYGLAKKTNTEDHLTNVGMELGTPAFSPPEQIGEDADAKNADELSDIFSLGQMLYVLLTFMEHDIPKKAEEYDIDLLGGRYVEVYKYSTNPRVTRYTTTAQFYNDLLESFDLDDEDVSIPIPQDELEDASKYDNFRRNSAIYVPKMKEHETPIKSGRTSMPTQKLPMIKKRKLTLANLFPEMSEYERMFIGGYLKLHIKLQQLGIDFNEIEIVEEENANVCADEKCDDSCETDVSEDKE